MSIRTALARWLAPEVFKEADKHQHLRHVLEDVSMWCGYEFPEIDAAIHYAKVTSRNHWRALGEPSVAAVPGKPWVWAIADFREHLRSGGARPVQPDSEPTDAALQVISGTAPEAPLPLPKDQS